MYIQPATGSVKIFGNWHPITEISKVSQNQQSPEDRIFLKEPIPVPNASYSRKSFKRNEIEKYKPS